jgi:aspartyl-tRNA synthetase
LLKPLEIKAYQYDIVCNGTELSSGAIRNHIPELMYKLFSVAGYDNKVVDEKFSGMINALSYGAPPHGGIAPGIDRIIMLLAGEKNIREVTMFPMNQNAQDLMMNAPSEIDDEQLKELNLSVKKNK